MTTTATTATPTVYHLRAVTDALAARTHLGATEKGSVTFCGVKLLMKGDERFGARYKNGPGFTASTDLATIDCGACKRGAAWKGAKGGKYTTTAPANRGATRATTEAATGGTVIEADAATGLPRIRPAVQARADRIVASQKARNVGPGK